MIVMFDSIQDNFPTHAVAVAGYDAGNWPTVHFLWFKRYRARYKLDICIHVDEDGHALDIENGDADLDSRVADWVTRQIARGIHRPVLYISVSRVDDLVQLLESHGIQRAEFKIWSAHYDSPLGAHVCGPSTCHECRVPCDGTQWTSKALGRNLDESLVNPDFFDFDEPNPHPEYDILSRTDHRNLHDKNGLDSFGGRGISEYGRIKTYDRLKSRPPSPERDQALKRVQHDCMLLFERIWKIVHRGGVEVGSKTAKRRFARFHRGERARILWEAAHGRR